MSVPVNGQGGLAPTTACWLVFPTSRLIAHYWVGTIAIVAHIACGLRMVLLRPDTSPPMADRLALALIAVEVVASSVILLALLNVHIA